LAKSKTTIKRKPTRRPKPKPLRPGEERRSTETAKPKPRRRASVKSSPAKSKTVALPTKLEVIDAKALIPPDQKEMVLDLGGKQVKLTNLQKVYWPDDGISKGDLLRYYAAISHVLLPHIQNRAMVMKRYPNGINGEFFFMKRTPEHAPSWLQRCAIEHESASIIEFPVINDLAALLWVVNLGCIDLNQWYARCDDVDRPDYMHFDLDPVKPVKGQKEVPFKRVLETALRVREGLAALKIPCYAKTSGSRGMHIYVPIKRGPHQKDVWMFAKAFAQSIARDNSGLITAVYAVAKRPAGHVLMDYNQNAWGRTLASVYSARPKRRAPVSAPVTWKEIERGFEIDEFRIENMPARVKKTGDLFGPLLDQKNAVDLEKLL
jgi:bifunctional non-homologous end joining protein LigD